MLQLKAGVELMVGSQPVVFECIAALGAVFDSELAFVCKSSVLLSNSFELADLRAIAPFFLPILLSRFPSLHNARSTSPIERLHL
jgi:hypothetical protein